MDDATLRARLQDLREGHTGDPQRGAGAFTEDARWRSNPGEPWLEGREAILEHFATVAGSEASWDPFEVHMERKVALVRYRFAHQTEAGEFVAEGWARLGLGDEHLTSWDAIWTEVATD